MGERPKVSVIIATHNDEYVIGNSIESVWSNEFPAVEVIAVDMNSTDGTKKELAEIAAGDEQVIFLADSMGSIGHAKNTGMDRARGEYIIFMEPGDEFHRSAIEYMSDKLDEKPESDMVTCETDSFGDDSYDRTIGEIRKRIADANHRDNRKQEMDSRLFRSWIFDNITMYRSSFLRSKAIRFYEEPGYGRQDDAFRFLAMAAGVVTILVDPLYERRMDIVEQKITDARITKDICDEFRFLEGRLKENSDLWWKMRLVFWQSYYDRNMLLYERLSDNLRPRLSRRMQADIKHAISRKEYSRNHFDITVRDEMELLIKSTDEFDRYQADKIRKRERERSEAHIKEDRFNELRHVESEVERISIETAEHMEQRRQENRLDKAWLTDEMARDMAPLRMLIGLSVNEMSSILGVSIPAYKSLEAGKKEISWDQYMALLFVFRYNDRTSPVTDLLGLYPEPLKVRMKKGTNTIYG